MPRLKRKRGLPPCAESCAAVFCTKIALDTRQSCLPKQREKWQLSQLFAQGLCYANSLANAFLQRKEQLANRRILTPEKEKKIQRLFAFKNRITWLKLGVTPTILPLPLLKTVGIKKPNFPYAHNFRLQKLDECCKVADVRGRHGHAQFLFFAPRN